MNINTPEQMESVADLETLDGKREPNTALRGETEASPEDGRAVLADTRSLKAYFL